MLGIDFFYGDSASKYNIMDPSFDRHGWVGKHMAKALEVTPGWLQAVKAKYGEDKKYGAVGTFFIRLAFVKLADLLPEGYCFGAPFVMKDGAASNITAGQAFIPFEAKPC